MSDSKIELSRAEMREMGYRVIDILVEHFATLGDQRVGAKADPREIFEKLTEPPPEHGAAYEPLLEQLTRDGLALVAERTWKRAALQVERGLRAALEG